MARLAHGGEAMTIDEVREGLLEVIKMPGTTWSQDDKAWLCTSEAIDKIKCLRERAGTDLYGEVHNQLAMLRSLGPLP